MRRELGILRPGPKAFFFTTASAIERRSFGHAILAFSENLTFCLEGVGTLLSGR